MEKYNYTWKINMIDGKSYYVLTNVADLGEFARMIIPPRSESERVSMFKCLSGKIEFGRMYNSVVILGSKVSSIEFYSKGEWPDEKRR